MESAPCIAVCIAPSGAESIVRTSAEALALVRRLAPDSELEVALSSPDPSAAHRRLTVAYWHPVRRGASSVMPLAPDGLPMAWMAAAAPLRPTTVEALIHDLGAILADWERRLASAPGVH